MKSISGSPNFFIGDKLKTKRKELKITQKELSIMLGVTFQQLQKYESGQSKVSIEMLIKICAAINVGFDYFLPELSSSSLPGKSTVLRDSAGTSCPVNNSENEQLKNRLIRLFDAITDRKLKILLVKVAEAMTEMY
jgi:transcriptional regulator with XRE-family HTH domain